MNKKILKISFAVLIYTALIFSASATSINLPYTEGIKVINYTVSDTLFIYIPAGNIIDSIECKPTFLVGTPGVYTTNITYICNDILYRDEFKSVTETSLFHLFTNKYTHDVRHMFNDDLSYHKEYETYVYKYCWFPIKFTEFYGSHSKSDENKVSVETEIFGHTGIKRASDIFDIYNSKAYASRNYTIDHTGYTDIDIIITYKIEGIHSVDYYIGQLSPTFKNLYKLGFAWLDKDLYILNLFIISDKLLIMVMFWFSVLSKSFVPLLFIVLIFGVPLLSYYNSSGRKGFINNMGTYYMFTFNIILSFMRYIVMMTLRILEIVRSLIPWI